MAGYVGRFAPSPTGPLHFGSLVAAVGSYLEARAHRGTWLVRMEDVDEPRTVPGAAHRILRTLEGFGLEWDGLVLYQSDRSDIYHAALEHLLDARLAFHCGCTRREVGGDIYPGTCRHGLPPGRTPRAVRVIAEAVEVRLRDGIQGTFIQELARDVGDFVVKRGDGYIAYQLAVVVDDAAQGVTHVVRGADLLDSTPRQIQLQRLLGYPEPAYHHLPVAIDGRGNKLSKQTGATDVDRHPRGQVLWQVLDFLNQQPPPELAHADLADLWAFARERWDIARVPRMTAIQVSKGLLDSA